jgi:hypothetical protein
VFASLWLLALLAVTAPLLALIPLPAIAALLLLVAWSLFDLAGWRRLWTYSRQDFAIAAATAVATVTIRLEVAILLGTVLSLVTFLHRTSKPSMRVMGFDSTDPARPFVVRADVPDPLPECPQLKMIRMEGEVYFGAVSHVGDQLRDLRAPAGSPKHLLVMAKSMNFIDLPAADLWRNELLTRRGIGGDLYFHRPRSPVLELWQRIGFLDRARHRPHLPGQADRDPDDLRPPRPRHLRALHDPRLSRSARPCRRRSRGALSGAGGIDGSAASALYAVRRVSAAAGPDLAHRLWTAPDAPGTLTPAARSSAALPAGGRRCPSSSPSTRGHPRRAAQRRRRLRRGRRPAGDPDHVSGRAASASCPRRACAYTACATQPRWRRSRRPTGRAGDDPAALLSGTGRGAGRRARAGAAGRFRRRRGGPAGRRRHRPSRWRDGDVGAAVNDHAARADPRRRATRDDAFS